MSKKQIKNDERVIALAECVLFAINNFKNKPIVDNDSLKMTTWHTWFKESLEKAGFKLKE